VTTVLLCRDGPVARYVAHEISDRLDGIVVESGRRARRSKLLREWRRTPWWRVPLLALDFVALAVYGRLWGRYIARALQGHPAASGYPVGVPVRYVDDANAQECVSALERLGPDVLLVLGTSILKADVLSIPGRFALNIHGGIVPRYRNVHSEVWAVLEDDAAHIGTTILHLGEGIDSGAVALQERITGPGGFFALRWRNVQLAARLAGEALARCEKGDLPRRPQDDSDAGFYPTPGARALLRLWWRSRGETRRLRQDPHAGGPRPES